jgi:hypothetical protein
MPEQPAPVIPMGDITHLSKRAEFEPPRGRGRRTVAAVSDSRLALARCSIREPQSTAARETPVKEQATDRHPLSDLAYDWITLIQNKAQALMTYDQYIKDAEQAGSAECATFFRKVHDTDKAQLAEAKQHLMAVLQGRMGGG